jgi:hypothetical protein
MAGFISHLKRAFYGAPEVLPISHPSSRRGIGNKIAAEYGHPDALILPDDMQRLFAGQWVLVSSSWIDALQYNQFSQTQGSLYAKLKTGRTYGPTLISPAEMGALASAPSKGHTINKIWRRARGR